MSKKKVKGTLDKPLLTCVGVHINTILKVEGHKTYSRYYPEDVVKKGIITDKNKPIFEAYNRLKEIYTLKF